MTIEAFDRHTLRTLFDDQRDPLFRFLYRLCGNPSDAEDLLQETFLTVWRKRDQFQGRGAAAGYLRRTAYRLFLNVREKRERRAGLLSLVDSEPRLSPSAASESERVETRAFLARQVRDAIEALPEPMREAFVLFRYEGLTCVQIAEVLDAPVKTVESRVRRATLALSEKLRAYAKHVHPS
jgi:RNA polymerase sigma-70 factor (ECF subfamily)